jgi:hypothetical protein
MIITNTKPTEGSFVVLWKWGGATFADSYRYENDKIQRYEVVFRDSNEGIEEIEWQDATLFLPPGVKPLFVTL